MDHHDRLREPFRSAFCWFNTDQPIRDRIASQLRELSIEVLVAEDEHIAIAQFGRQSFPVMSCDRVVATSDGTELVRQVTCISIEPGYVLMMAGEMPPSADGIALSRRRGSTHAHERFRQRFRRNIACTFWKIRNLPVATVAASLAYRLLAEGTVTQVTVAAL